MAGTFCLLRNNTYSLSTYSVHKPYDQQMMKKNTDQQQIIDFGKKMRSFRIKQGLSQEDLSQIVGLHRTYIGGIERGERNPSLKNIAKIAAALNVTIKSFFED